jgi:1,4-dihydroxy-2-naphthoyl-CoA hydrolase
MIPDAQLQPPFADSMGIKVTQISPDRVVGELLVRDKHGNGFGMLHGGAAMALADSLGGMATMANLPKGSRTATIESKTNFFAAISVGDTARAESTPLIAAALRWFGRRASRGTTENCARW